MSKELDTKLKKLAQEDWETFLTIVGQDGVLTMKARILRKNGKSYQQISVMLGGGLTPKQVRTVVNKNSAAQNGQTNKS